MKLSIQDTKGQILLSTLPDQCEPCIERLDNEYGSVECPHTRNICRRAIINNKDYVIKVCSQSIKTTKNFKDAIQVYKWIVPFIQKTIFEVQQASEQAERGFTKTLLHNLVNQNAHTIQLLDQFLPQNERFAEVSATITNTKNKVIDAPEKVALSLFKLKKIASSMKAEFSAYDRFRNGNTAVSPKVYKLYDVVKIVAHIFFADLHERNVYVRIDQCYEKGYFDFEVMRVALYYIFENAAKYTKRNSQIVVSFDHSDNMHCITITMESLYVEPNEEAHIFEKGFSGKCAKKSRKSGTGLGMYHAKELIKLTNGDIRFSAGSKVSNMQNGEKYATNKVQIIIPQVPQSITLYKS